MTECVLTACYMGPSHQHTFIRLVAIATCRYNLVRHCCLQMVAHELQYLEGMQDTDGGVYCVVKPNTAYGEYYE